MRGDLSDSSVLASHVDESANDVDFAEDWVRRNVPEGFNSVSVEDVRSGDFTTVMRLYPIFRSRLIQFDIRQHVDWDFLGMKDPDEVSRYFDSLCNV